MVPIRRERSGSSAPLKNAAKARISLSKCYKVVKKKLSLQVSLNFYLHTILIMILYCCSKLNVFDRNITPSQQLLHITDLQSKRCFYNVLYTVVVTVKKYFAFFFLFVPVLTSPLRFSYGHLFF